MKQKRTFFKSCLVEEEDKVTLEEWDWIDQHSSYSHEFRPEFIISILQKESVSEKVIKLRYKDATERIKDILYQACLENDTKSDGNILFFTLGELPTE